MPGGRPTKYTKALADKILHLVSEGYSINKISAMDGMPHRSTIHQWIFDKPEFSDKYVKAKDIGLRVWADEIIDIADDSGGDVQIRVNDKGQEYEVTDNERINRARLRCDSRRWLLSKLVPKKYGDKVDVTTDGEKINTAPVINVVDSKTADALKGEL